MRHLLISFFSPKRNAHIFLGYIFGADYATYVCELIAVFMQTRPDHDIPIYVHFRKLLEILFSGYLDLIAITIVNYFMMPTLA